MRLQIEKSKDDKKKIKDLEKKCKLLEETLNSKKPNSIPLLIQAAKTDAYTTSDQESKRELVHKIKMLEEELEQKDIDYDKKLRSIIQ